MHSFFFAKNNARNYRMVIKISVENSLLYKIDRISILNNIGNVI